MPDDKSATQDHTETGAKGSLVGGETKVDDKAAAEKAAAEKKGADDKAAADAKAAADKKAVDDKAAADAETKRKADEATAKSKAPEKYALTLPKGAEDWLDESDLKNLERLARAEGWSQEDAQERLDEHADLLAAQSAAFRAITEADDTYGGDKLAETQRFANLVLDKVRPKGTPHGDALRKILVKSGYGNNLEIVSFLADLGKGMAEDRLVDGRAVGGGGSGPASARPPEEVLYGKT